MSDRIPDGVADEHELPSVEAVLAGTLALMTGYSQALQAALHPEKRLAMGAKIGWQLALLSGSAQLSPGFRDVLHDLRQHWLTMTACTLDSRPVPADAGTASASASASASAAPPSWWSDAALSPPHRRH